jgi:hypothetical protein
MALGARMGTQVNGVKVPQVSTRQEVAKQYRVGK